MTDAMVLKKGRVGSSALATVSVVPQLVHDREVAEGLAGATVSERGVQVQEGYAGSGVRVTIFSGDRVRLFAPICHGLSLLSDCVRTVLAVKGSLRRAYRRALDSEDRSEAPP